MNILLVDDQLLFLESLKIVIENLGSDMKIVGMAGNGKEACEKVDLLDIDIILMDVRMPIMDGVSATKIIKQKHPLIHIIMLTTFEDDEYVKDALHNGAAGYMLKNIPPEMLISSIRAVQNGAVSISPSIAGHLIDNMYSNNKKAATDLKRDIPDWYNLLNSREKNIIKLLINGKTNSEIAESIFVGSQTIRNYISVIYSKLDVGNRADAIRKANNLDSFFYD
ncbi:MAG: response regulator transcription factor [Spirochaetaceae bacterium]